MSFINLSPGDGEVRQALGGLFMKVSAIASRESERTRERRKGKKHGM